MYTSTSSTFSSGWRYNHFYVSFRICASGDLQGTSISVLTCRRSSSCCQGQCESEGSVRNIKPRAEECSRVVGRDVDVRYWGRHIRITGTNCSPAGPVRGVDIQILRGDEEANAFVEINLFTTDVMVKSICGQHSGKKKTRAVAELLAWLSQLVNAY